MNSLKENLPGIFPATIKIYPPTTSVTKVDLKLGPNRISLQAKSLIQSPGSRDRDLQLKVGTSRTRRGNKKH